MNENLTLRTLEQVMAWDEDTLSREFVWLRLMARFKYDSYRDYVGGVRFLECLVDWLQQFHREDRQIAYNYIKQHLIFISRAEMEHLVDRFFPEYIDSALTNELSAAQKIPRYDFWEGAGSDDAYMKELKKSLFLGLSDGARIDVFRRANEGRISNEQVIATTQLGDGKWKEFRKKLEKAVEEESPRFKRIFLIDDFTGSGKTLLRWDENDQCWDGKLKRFYDDNEKQFVEYMEEGWQLYVHHYIASFEAAKSVELVEAKAREALGGVFANQGLQALSRRAAKVMKPAKDEAVFSARSARRL